MRPAANWQITLVPIVLMLNCGDLSCDASSTEPQCLPDLTITAFRVGFRFFRTESAFALCVEDADESITIANQGRQDSGPYRSAITLYDYDATTLVDGCAVPVHGGTKAGDTTVLGDLGCCKFGAQPLDPQHQYRILLMADAGQEVTERDEENNLSPSDTFLLTE